MNSNIAQSLYQITQNQCQENRHLVSRFQPFNTAFLPAALYTIACQARAVESMSDAEIMPVFFSDAALTILTPIPNQYWMWVVIQNALNKATTIGGKRISGQDVIDAVHCVRNQYRHKYDLTATIATLQPAANGTATRESKIASRAAAGLILIKTNACEFDEMVDNPLFFDPHFIGSR